MWHECGGGQQLHAAPSKPGSSATICGLACCAGRSGRCKWIQLLCQLRAGGRGHGLCLGCAGRGGAHTCISCAVGIYAMLCLHSHLSCSASKLCLHALPLCSASMLCLLLSWLQFAKGNDGEGGLVGQYVGESGQAQGLRISGGRLWGGQVGNAGALATARAGTSNNQCGLIPCPLTHTGG